MEIIYGDPKKLSSFKKAGKLASIQPNSYAVFAQKKVYKTKVLKFRIKVLLYKSAVK